MPRVSAAVIVWVAAVSAAAVYAIGFYPGFLSFDSAYQWWQARSGQTSDIAGVGIVLLWRGSNALAGGPAALFLCQLALFWCGVARIVTALAPPTWRALLLISVLALAPVHWLLAHLWSDMALLSCLLFGFAALLHYRDSARRHHLGAAILLFLLACSLRHNAIFAVAPLLYFAVSLLPAQSLRRSAMVRVLLSTALGVGMVGIVHITTRLHTREHMPMLPSLALWDLTGMSVRSNAVLLPDYAVDPRVNVADLASAYVPWSNTPLFSSARAGVRYAFAPWSNDELQRLRADWLRTIAQHPGAYLQHRGELMRALFGVRSRELPAELTYVADMVAYRDNPTVARNSTRLNQLWLAQFDRLRDTVVFAAWPYLLLGLFAALHAWRRPNVHSPAVLWLVASAYAYALPYLLLAPAAELRYLAWSCSASLIAVALCSVPRRLASRA